MVQAWEHLGEIQRKLRSPLLLPTVGNHDVDSRKIRAQDPFDLPKSFHPEFPRPDPDDRDMFWQRGFYYASIRNKAAFLVLNTVIGHHDNASAERGTFKLDLIDGMRTFLPSGIFDAVWKSWRERPEGGYYREILQSWSGHYTKCRAFSWVMP